MKHTRLIPIIIIAMMLFNCILPIMPVHAATNKTITLNRELYDAISEQLKEQKINAIFNDLQRRIIISEQEIEKVTSLNLKEKGIADLTGLSEFKNLKELILTGNGLNSKSNLEELNALTLLEDLDLSSNNIETIENLTILDSISSEKLKLHSQRFTKIEVINSPVSDTVIELPEIIKYAGTLNFDWFKVYNTYDEGCKLDLIYQDDYFTIDEYQTEGVAKIKINTTTEKDDYSIETNKYLMKLEIIIPENEGEAIAGSTITIYYLVLDSDERGAIFNDEKLYNAVKKQLTHGKNDINSELRTYIDGEDGETLYKKAYDEPQIMVFDLNTLINDIPALELKSLKVEDLTGIEAFVGLEKELNLYDNYVSSLEKILELQENKNIEEDLLQERFTKKAQTSKESVKASLDKLIQKIAEFEAIEKQIESANTKIANAEEAIREARSKKNNPEATEAEIKAQDDIIVAQGKIIDENTKLLEYDRDGENNVTIRSLYGQRVDVKGEIDSQIDDLNQRMDELYEIYNKKYRATTILPLDLNKLTLDEFNYIGQEEDKNESLNKLKQLHSSIVNKIATIEGKKGLSNFEKRRLKEEFGISFKIDEPEVYSSKLGVPEAWEELEPAVLIGNYKERIEKFVKIDLEAKILNYLSIYKTHNPEVDEEELIFSAIEYIEEFIQENRTTYQVNVLKGLLKINNTEELYISEDVQSKINELYEEYDIINYREKLEEEKSASISDIKEDTSFEYIKGDANSQLMGLAGKFATLTPDEIEEYVKLPALKKLNIEDNALESLEGIQRLPKLEELNASNNQIVDFVTINNEDDVEKSFANTMRVLNLSENFIDNKGLKLIETLKNLEELYIRKNLLSGDFDFNLQRILIADFSNNQYSNIEHLIQQINKLALTNKMEMGEYLRNRIDIRFYNQDISVDLGKIIIEDGNKKIEQVDLSKVAPILYQIEELESELIEFKKVGVSGTVKPQGKLGVLVSEEEGKYNASVSLLTKDEYYYDGILSIGDGTDLVLYYETVKAKVNSVKVNAENDVAEVELGKTIQFNATVDAENVEDTSVVWTIERFDDEGNVVTTESTTNINEDGLLTIDPNETATKIVVTARSNFDNSKFATAEVKVVKLNTTVAITTVATETGLEQGSNKTYAATVTTEAEDKTVTWTVTGNTSENTKFENNVLTIGEDEEVGTKLTITATSNYDNTKTATVEETVIEKIEQVTVEITSAADEKGLEQGSSKTYTATVKKADGTDAKVTTVEWTVTGNTSENTKFENNVLTIAEDEEVGTELTITATSNYDNTKTATVKETVISNKVVVNKPTKDNMVFEQTPGTTVSEFISELVDTTHTVELVDENGNEVAETAKLVTGMKVKIDDKTEYAIVVTGDVNSDGKADSLDSDMIKEYRLGGLDLTDIQIKAADINADGSVNRIDSFIILLYRAGSTQVTDFTKDTIDKIMK